MKKNLLFLRKFNHSDIQFLKSGLEKNWNFLMPESFDEHTLLSFAKDADAAFGFGISAAILDQAPNLKLVQIPGAGLNLVNLEVFKDRNVTLCNSHSNSYFVAEFAIALLNSLMKKIAVHDALLRNGNWYTFQGNIEDRYFTSDTLRGKKIGLLGFGHIGQKIAHFLQPYEVELLTLKRSTPQYLYPSLEKHIQFLDKNQLMAESDVILCSLPLTEQTKDFLSEQEFSLMKENAYIVNVGRGEVINEQAFYQSLLNHRIKGAAIDVWYPKEDKNNKYPSDKFDFHSLKNIVVSPYRAGYLGDASPHLFDVVDNLNRFAEGKPLINIVEISKGY